MEHEEVYDLLIDEDFAPGITDGEALHAKPIIDDFVRELDSVKDSDLEGWLSNKMQSYLPEKSKQEVDGYAKEIMETISVQDQKKLSLKKSLESGKSRESWFACEISRAVSNMTAQQSMEYMRSLDNAVNEANAKMYQTILTKDGIISNNSNLDGFIAEQYHAQTFNLNAAVRGSTYRARVIEPDGGYSKNGVDIVVENSANGKLDSKYQSKYYKTSKDTANAFVDGDYRGQQKLIPSDQSIDKKSTTVLKAKDGTTSNPLPKTHAAEMRNEAQNGKWNELNWNEYAVKDLAMGIGKQAANAGVLGAAFGAGVEIVDKIVNYEEVTASDVAVAAINGGADAGIKAAAAGALKVCAEKGIIKAIPKGTPAGIFANIACVAIENIKILGQVMTKKISPAEGLSKMGEVTTSCIAGAIASIKGTSIGAAIGTIFGPIGTAIGGFVGGCVGYLAGSKIGKAVYGAFRKVGKAAVSAVKTIGRGLKSIGNAFKNLILG